LDSEQEVVEWILKPLAKHDRNQFETSTRKDVHLRTKYKSFDCSIMEVADDIAYGVHDFEDAISLKLVSEGDFRDSVLAEACRIFLDALKSKYPAEAGNDVYENLVTVLFGNNNIRKRSISRLTKHFLTNVKNPHSCGVC
jgi:dGTPase